MRVHLKPGRLPADNLLVERIEHAGPVDRGDIVLGWLTRVTVVLALLGLIGFDLIALGMGKLKVEDGAQQAARAAVRAYSETADVQRAYEAALAESADTDTTIAPGGFSVAPDGAVTLTVEHTAPTLLVEKVEQIRSWAVSRSTVTGRPSS